MGCKTRSGTLKQLSYAPDFRTLSICIPFIAIPPKGRVLREALESGSGTRLSAAPVVGRSSQKTRMAIR